MAKKKQRLPCDTCNFTSTGGPVKEGDICPWCRKGKLTKQKKDD